MSNYYATASLLTAAAPGAANTISVTATDSNGLSATDSITVYGISQVVDSTGPTVTWSQGGVDANVDGGNGTIVVLSGTVTDASGVASLAVTKNAVAIYSTTSFPANGFSFPVTLATGANAIVATFTDKSAAANTTVVSFTLTLAHAAPDVTGPTVGLITPGGDTTIAGPVGESYVVRANASDPSGIASATINSVAVTPDGSGNISLPITLAAGANLVTIVATDASAGQDAKQQIVTTGTPTGGTFTLTYNTHTTGNLNYNAAASDIQTALRALTGVGTDVTCTGGALPTPVVVEFTGTHGNKAQALITHADSLTGGSSPAVAITTTQTGSTGSNATTKTATITLVPTLGPTLTVTEPASSAVTVQGADGTLYEVAGNVTSAAGIASLTINGSPVPFDAQGNFTDILILRTGQNTLTITAVDAAVVPQTTTLSYLVTLVDGPPGPVDISLSSDQLRIGVRIHERGTE